ncbi:MAG: NUDIX hydrolase [Planctomycetales bacterium]|nr:NUDIX hydrolase [Planctomycetales bacterium]MBN8624346.1 NUDIX hydrolase [Planctomycetota bacterium]
MRNIVFRQALAIPYRVCHGRLEICLVTSLRKRRWCFPKGYVEPGETETQAALKEAWEEAGLTGKIVGESLGTYDDKKLGTTRRITCYTMLVARSRRTWKESDLRERCWLPAGEALEMLSRAKQRDILAVALQRLVRRLARAG